MNKEQIYINIETPFLVRDNISDLLCWWQGFKMGLKVAGIDYASVADNGIEAIEKINGDIKTAIINQLNKP